MGLLYTAVGVSVLWARWGRGRLKTYALPQVVQLIPCRDEIRHLIEFIVFLVIGVFVACGVVNPRSPTQALSAGFAWTSFFVHPNKRHP
jgi:hypothetical protein